MSTETDRTTTKQKPGSLQTSKPFNELHSSKQGDYGGFGGLVIPFFIAAPKALFYKEKAHLFKRNLSRSSVLVH